MSTHPATKKSQKSSISSNTILLIVLGVVVISVLFFLAMRQSSNNVPFGIVDGTEVVVVLLRTEDDGTYTLRYDGDSPANIQNLQVMLAGQILHADVEMTSLSTTENQVDLVNNQVPEGEQFVLQPNDFFNVTVNFSGQTLGYNYVYGFRIGFEADGKTRTVDVVEEDFKYLVNVE